MSRRILFYINAINGGGAEKVILQLAGHFANAGYSCWLLTSFADDEFEYPVPKKVKRISIDRKEIKECRIKKNVRRIKALRVCCKKYRPDVLISFMAEPNFRAVIATRGLSIKTIVSVRNDPSKEYAGIFKIIGKWMIPMADGCVFQTEEAKKWFPKKLQRKSRVIVNEISPDFFQIPRSENPKDIIAVGRLSEQKNYKMMIQAFSLIAFEFPDERLMIYGEGNQRKELEMLIEKLNLKNRVRLMGQTKDIPSVLSEAKIFVLSSDFEGMPNALMEAMAAGVPCIAADCPCGGPAYLIEDRINGLLTETGDIEAMAEKMRCLLKDGRLCEEIGKNAKKSSEKYLPANVFRIWKDYVENLM